MSKNLTKSPALLWEAGLFVYLFIAGFAQHLAAAEGDDANPATEITQVEERLLTMAPFLNGWAEELSQQGLAAAAKRTYPTAPLLEPKALGEPQRRKHLDGWQTTLSQWVPSPEKERRYQPGNSLPLQWLSALIPETGAVRIKTLDGELVPQKGTYLFRTHHEFLVSSKPGTPNSQATAELKLDWGSDGKQLLVIRWQLLSVKFIESSLKRPLVASEELQASIPDEATYKELRECRHEAYMRAAFQYPSTLKERGLPGFDLHGYDHITYESTDQHPGVSVVDINDDGHDDLYLVRRWGKNRLLINQGNSTFIEASEKYGLAIEGPGTCSLFLDFDNDGDQDVFIGRSLRRPLFMENRDGLFVDVSDRISGAKLPYLTTSAAAADYDGDGLIDIYIGTYGGRSDGWKHDLLEPEDIAEFTRRALHANPFYDFAAAPNLLLRNLGGMRFERAPEDPQTRLWRATLQPTFADWDNDGDPDLLVTNDFGPDVMLRNDPDPDGVRKFVDVTAEHAPDVATNYFGMGGSWGDYDNDGHLDLYLSAMYSKAGSRITKRLGDYDLRARQSTKGNLLFRGSPATLTKSSGLTADKHQVARVGWSWGGQFFDPDNDGYLDIYAPTGYFTPPDDLALDVDY